MMFLMSPERPSSQDESTKLMTQIERNHVLMHQQQQPLTPSLQQIQFVSSSNNNLIMKKNNFLTTETTPNNNNNVNILNNNKCNSLLTTTTTTTTTSSPLHPTTMGYIKQELSIEDQNEAINNRIFLLANEQMEPSDNEQNPDEDTKPVKVSNGGTDEELTPLHWLHDKNLLKGINLSCSKVRSPSNGHGRSNGSNSDSPDDSGVSEDNTSSANSVEQNGPYNNSDASPKAVNYTTTDSNLLISTLSSANSLGNNISQQQQNSSIISSNSNLSTTENSSNHNNNNNNNNNNNINSNNNNNNNMNSLNNNYKMVATTAAGLSNNSNSTEYYQSNHYDDVVNHGGSPMASQNGNSQPQTPHQHFHKKYLREQLKQQDEAKKQQQPQPATTYIRNQVTSQYIYADDRDFINNYSNNNNNINNNTNNNTNNNNNNNNINNNNINNTTSYDKHDYDLSPKNNNNNNIEYSTPKASYSSNSSSASSSSSSPSPKMKPHPNIPYDPLVHTTSKPPYSFSSLIFMAIEDSNQKALPVKEIYAWITSHFPYFKTAPTGWKNSVRHNLSLNKCFQKVEKAANLGKGSLWMVEPQYRPNLIQALTRSPFHPCSTLDKNSYKTVTVKTPSESPSSKGSGRLPNPEHFPYLSRRLAAAMEGYDEEGQSRASTPSGGFEATNYNSYNGDGANGMVIYHNNNNSIIINGNLHSPEILGRDIGADTIDDVNAATAMLALKHGPKIFTDGIFTHPPVITSSPSEDHTYSAFTGGKNGTETNSNGTSSDAAYESSEESNVVYHFSQALNEQELEEQRRQAEGVDALLNLAGYNTNTTLLLKRPASSDSQFERKQYFYTTEIAPTQQQQQQQFPIQPQQQQQPTFYSNGEPPAKKAKSRILRNKLKKKSWYR